MTNPSRGEFKGRSGPLKPDAAAVVAAVGDQVRLPARIRTDPAVRDEYLRRVRRPVDRSASLQDPGAERGDVYDIELSEDLRVRIYRPDTDQVVPVVVYAHGGGWVSGDLDGYDQMCRILAMQGPFIVVSVDYRLAPEHPFPAAMDDVFAATCWAAEYATDIGGDPTRLAVMGSSAGGNLVAATTLRARDGGGPVIALQILVYPALDPSMGTPSMTEFATGHVLEKDMVSWYWDQYVPDPRDRTLELAAPARAQVLVGLPPALVIMAECDPLRDEGENYAARLARAGVSVDVTRYPGQLHGFLGMLDVVEDARPALNALVARMGALLAQPAD